MGLTVLLFSLWRLADLITAFIAKIYDKYEEHFMFKYILEKYNRQIPHFLVSFANYDGAHYLHIAKHGYGLNQQAFFPLFPLLIHVFKPLIWNSYFLSGLFITNFSFLLGLYFFKNYLDAVYHMEKSNVWKLVLLITFPTSFFFGAVYSEGLFFFFLTGSLYFLQKKKLLFLIFFCYLASLTRLIGLFLVIPLLMTLFIENNRVQNIRGNIHDTLTTLLLYLRKNLKKVFILFVPIIGLCTYMTYLYLSTKNPLLFYQSLSGFHTGRSTTRMFLLPQVYYRYINIFLKAPHNITYFVAIMEFVTFNIFFGVLLYDLWLLWKKKDQLFRISLIGLNIFSLVVLILPTFTGTMTSLPRYALFSLSFFLRLAQIKNIIMRISIVLIFILLHILLLTMFIQGYFIS